MEKDNLENAPGPTTKDSRKKGAGARRQKTKKERLQERAKAVGLFGWEKMTEKKLRTELHRIKSEGGIVPDLRSGNKGVEKPGNKEYVVEMKETHLMEEIDVIIRENGVPRRGKKNRLIAILDMLSTKAVNLKDVPAAKEYLDRTLGKAKQEIELGIKAEDQVPPSEAEVKASLAFNRVLLNELRKKKSE